MAVVSPVNELERADEIIKRLAADPVRGPKVQQIIADARLFDSLRQEPGWQRLWGMVQAKRERWMVNVTKRFMGAKKNWPAPEEIAYYQGFYFGAVFVLAHPEHAEESLERAARIAWAMTLEDDEEDGD